MEVDYGPGRELIESLMKDQCRIERDPGGVEDDVLDPETLILSPTADELVYSGIALFKPIRPRPDYQEIGGDPRVLRTYEMLVPFDIYHLQPYDVVTITASQDGFLQDRKGWIVDITGKTHNVYRYAVVQFPADHRSQPSPAAGVEW